MARIAELLGTPLTPAQRYVYDVALEVQTEEAGDPEPGVWAYDEPADFEPRRAGKTFKIGPLVAHRCGSGPRRTAWITAQKRQNAVDRWADVCDQLEGPGRLSLRRNTATTREVLKFLGTRGAFRPFAPKATAMHGDEPDLVIVDELWAHDLAAKSAIEQGYKPAWIVKPGQAWLMSAAGTSESTWLNGRRARGAADVAAGRRLGRATFDWGVPEEVGGIPVEELPGDQLLEVVLECHPRRDAYLPPGGFAPVPGIRRAYLAEQLDDMGRTDFLRAYGNRTAEGNVETVIESAAFRRAKSSTPIPPSARVGLAFHVDPDRREAVVSAAWRDTATGVMHTEVLKSGPEARWVAAYVRGVVARQEPGAVAVLNAGPARGVADELDRMGVELLRVPATDYAAACGRFYDEVTAPRPTLLHRGEKSLTDALAAASKRRVPGGFVWDQRGEEPITALAAHTLAVWAHDHMPAAPRRFRIA